MNTENRHQTQQQQQQQQQRGNSGSPNSSFAVDFQQQGIDSLLQNLERLEHTADKFFDSLAMVGQGPPSLLAAQLVSMTQTCQQMSNDAKTASLLNVPVSTADPVFTENAAILPRYGTGEHKTVFESANSLEDWVQQTTKQTEVLFAERLRLTANVQAALSVPPSKHLDLV
ncbi:hypothetical protein GGI25_002433 [Coemansia spiralis]|uniref:Uncharacterized protein n=2 Tax=Coemansia TaxID=4863 RepID=A0A9W8GA06_9FUNG|nr:hypothetical protein EDC05_001004 [Coemansia umbellata]KAJ2678261.1 hypothetical protein GGI25_002433 [Coemansia spiralis]